MSKQNVEIVRQGFEHFQTTGDFSATRTPDFVWDMSKFRGWPEQRTYEGLDGARGFIKDWTGVFDEWSVELEDIRDAGGDKVVAFLHQRGVSKLSGLATNMLLGVVYTVRDGNATRIELYADPAEALKAVGLEE